MLTAFEGPIYLHGFATQVVDMPMRLFYSAKLFG